MFAGISEKEVSEVGRTDGKNQLVSGKVVFAAGKSHVDELFLVTQIFGQLKEGLVMIVPFKQ